MKWVWVLKLTKGNEKVIIKRAGMSPILASELYSLYRYAEKKGKYELTVKEFLEDPGWGALFIYLDQSRQAREDIEGYLPETMVY